MIDKIRIYQTSNLYPYRNLAVEEYLTFHTEPGECILYLWQNKNTVVIGRNQDSRSECRTADLEAAGGYLARRLSGGGAVYHDLGNLNFTFCVRKEDYSVERQTEVILQAVKSLGIQAERTGRNDLTADGRKFSGNAYYHSGDFCYHHGTLLVDVDQQQMSRFLNVSPAKLASKGVRSVRSRTVNLKTLKEDLTIEELKEALSRSFEKVYERTALPFPENRLDMESIARSEERFSSRLWNYGPEESYENRREHRFPWGNLDIRFLEESGRIRELRVYTDSMDDTLAPSLEKLLTGASLDPESISRALDGLASEPEGLREWILTLLDRKEK